MRRTARLLGALLLLAAASCAADESRRAPRDDAPPADAGDAETASPCDHSGSCTTCTACAQQAECEAEATACGTNPDCSAYSICVQECADDGGDECVAECDLKYLDGRVLYNKLQRCTVCQTCVSDCSARNQPCPY